MSDRIDRLFCEAIEESDDTVVGSALLHPVGPGLIDSDVLGCGATLAAAMGAAAVGAWRHSEDLDMSMPIETRKKQVDGAATDAAERVLSRAGFAIRVVAGEGPRDDSPGAIVGQCLGAAITTEIATREPLDGVFDYVDGTGLAANRAPGALALGGLGRGLRSVPDLQAYAVLLPNELMDRVTIMTRPEDHAVDILERIASLRSSTVHDLTVFTHSIASTLTHFNLIRLLRDNVANVIVPEAVTIEAPYLVSLSGLASPRIDTMMGAIGLSELAFSALLLDLLCPSYGFLFRVASLAGPRKNPRSETMSVLFDFSSSELRAYRAAGFDPQMQYASTEIVPPGSGRAAAMFAVTDNPVLGLSAPVLTSRGVTAEGLVFTPRQCVTKLRITYAAK